MQFWSIPNLISFLRLPMAILFLTPNIILRISIITVAAITDFLDGYIARRYNKITRFGTLLDHRQPIGKPAGEQETGHDRIGPAEVRVVVLEHLVRNRQPA